MAANNTKKQLSINVIWTLSVLLINTLTSFILTPYITQTLGIEAYGFITLADNFVSYIDIVIVSLNSLAARYITISYHKKQYEEAQKFFNSVLTADLFLSFVITVIFAAVINRLEWFIQIPDQLIDDVKILFALVIVNYLINMCGVVFKACVYIKNRMDYISKTDLAKLIFKIIILVSLFSVFKPHVWYVTLSLIPGTMLVFIVFTRLTRKLTPELKIDFHKASLKSVLEIVSVGIWNSVNSLGNTLNSGLDLLAANIWISPIAMGELSIAQKISSIMMQFLSNLSGVFAPLQLEDYAKGEKKQILNNLVFCMKSTGMFCIVCFCVYFSVGLNFLSLWIPEENISAINILTRIVLTGNIIVGICYPLYYVNTLTKKLKIPCVVTICSGLTNVFSMWLLVSNTSLGVYAVVLTTLVINWVTNFTFVPMYAAKSLGLKVTAFLPTVFRYLFALLASLLGCILIHQVVALRNSWLFLFVECVIYGLISVIIAGLFFLNSKERKLFIQYLLRIIVKR